MTPKDDHPLRRSDRPHFEEGDRELRVVDLFAGCGGLTLGVAQAAQHAGARLAVPLAVDFEAAAVDVYSANFPTSQARLGTVEQFFDGDLGGEPTPTELQMAELCGQVHMLVGGPPCQGHSNLNNHTRRDDPKNALYARMARAAEVLRPQALLIENVPAVDHDRSKVVEATRKHLEVLGYEVAAATVGLHALGVAQTRHRHVLLATTLRGIDPAQLLKTLTDRTPDPDVNLRWAIGDLERIADPRGYDLPSVPSAENLKRMQYLLDHDLYDLPNDLRPVCHRGSHSYVSMYGRLRWERPAQTVTSGYGSIGQGRYMHPGRRRALTGHEAARLQGFPDYFRFDAVIKRGTLATMIGNAVPPALSREVVTSLLPHLLGMPEAAPLPPLPPLPPLHQMELPESLELVAS